MECLLNAINEDDIIFQLIDWTVQWFGDKHFSDREIVGSRPPGYNCNCYKARWFSGKIV